jgi:hypothetical protein
MSELTLSEVAQLFPAPARTRTLTEATDLFVARAP